nr:hypothetical protein [Tanacetum cinerariifolium]
TNDFVSCDNSDKSSDLEAYVSYDSSPETKTKDSPTSVDVKTMPESDIEDPKSTSVSPSFSCLENVKTPRIFCNKSGMNNKNVCKNNFVRVKKCFVCGSKLHLIKDCDFYNCVDSIPCKSKAASVPTGSRNSSALVNAGRSDSAASRNRPVVNSAGRPNPAGRIGKAAHHSADQPNPASWSKRPAPVSAGWFNPAARPYFRPSSAYFNNLDDEVLLLSPQQGDPRVDNDLGIVDSGCSRSMIGNKEILDDFVQVKGGIVKFRGGDDSVPCKSKATSVPTGSRNSSASVNAGRSDSAASRNKPVVNSAGRPNPAGRIRKAAHHSADQPNPACWSKRPAPVSAGRPVSVGWFNPAARPYFRPSSAYFNNLYWPEIYDSMYGDPRVDNDLGIVDSGCSRSMIGNKEMLDDFV